MNDKQARSSINDLWSSYRTHGDRIRILEDNAAFLLDRETEPLRLYIALGPESAHKISVKEAVEAILQHLGLELAYVSAVKSKASLKEVESDKV